MPTDATFFDSGLTKGEEGLEPALVVASDDNDDYAFIDISRAAFDLTDRGVAGRDPPGPAMPSSMWSAASIAAARRCMPPSCCATATPTSLPMCR